MKQVRFEESEVPYQTLARFGLTQEKIEDLPCGRWKILVRDDVHRCCPFR